MATVTMQDGSTLELSAEEFMLYLQATGQVAAPKTDAERIAERMIELRNGNVATSALEQHAHIAEVAELKVDLTEQIEDAVQEAIADVVVMPGGKVVPLHVGGPTPPRPKVNIPYTQMEMEVMNILKEHAPHGITSKVIAERLGRDHHRTSGILSGIFHSKRGIARGIHSTWYLETWALRAIWFQHGTPTRHWPPPTDKERTT